MPAPMLATVGRPPDTPGRWAIEMKWDGMRAVCGLAGGRGELYSPDPPENVTACYPELTDALAQRAHGTDMIVDGEIVALDPATGAPSFVRLRQRMHLTRPARELVEAVPVELFVFVRLEREGVGTMGLPYVERRARLSELALTGNGVHVPPCWTDIPIETMLDTAASHRLEGVVSKRVDSVYRPGTRSRLWLKTAIRQTTEVVIAGWVPSSSSGGEQGALGTSTALTGNPSRVDGSADTSDRHSYGHPLLGRCVVARFALTSRSDPAPIGPAGDRRCRQNRAGGGTHHQHRLASDAVSEMCEDDSAAGRAGTEGGARHRPTGGRVDHRPPPDGIAPPAGRPQAQGIPASE